MPLKGERNREYMREYMRRKRAAERTGAPKGKAAPTKPAGADHAVLVRELAQARARIAEQAAEIAKLTAAVKAAQAAPNRGDGGGAGEIARLQAQITYLDKRLRMSRFSADGYIVPKAEFNHWRFCAHPDRITGLIDLVRDAIAGEPVEFDEAGYEKLVARFSEAARTLTEFKDVLVNEAAEQAGKRAEAFRATGRWKMEEVLRKKADANREAAAAKRAARKQAAT